MADHPQLLRHDVQLLADFHANLTQRGAIVRAGALVFRQLVAHHFARQRRVQRPTTALGPLVCGHLNKSVLSFLTGGLGHGAFEFGLVEEQVLLVCAEQFALGREQLALELDELFLEQVALGAVQVEFAGGRLQLGSEGLTALRRLGQGALQDRLHNQSKFCPRLTFSNPRRLHSSLNYISPMQFERARLTSKQRQAA